MTTQHEIDNVTSNPDRLLHILWTKAVGTPGYNKAEWMKLEAILKEYSRMCDEWNAPWEDDDGNELVIGPTLKVPYSVSG